MTDRSTWRDLILDAFVYAPTGLAITVAEELPHLVDKGRHRIEGRITTARVVGQFAWQFARQQFDQRRDGTVSPLTRLGRSRPSGSAPAGASRSATGPAPAPEGPPAEDGSPVPSEPPAEPVATSTVADIRQAGATRRARAAGSQSRAAGSPGRATRSQTGVGRPPSDAARSTADEPTGSGHAAEGTAPDSDALGIPGYDTLSASQVVQRLAGLTREQLERVQAHELAGRHRRTVLHRVDQLLSGAGLEG
jgi:hypothetical protein